MQIGPDRFLTYCTNIHPADGWPAVRETLEAYAPRLKAALSPGAPFAVGLRLSGRESRELLEGDHLARFRDYLAAEGLVVYTINGFPYGPFHRAAVKDRVHAPDWREPERVAYTLRLAEILAAVLPEGMDGGISTNPLAYRLWFGEGDEHAIDRATWTLFVRHLVEVVTALVRLREAKGTFIHIDVEPEPDGVLGDSRDLVRFFEDWLLPAGAPLLAEALGTSRDEARARLLEHVQVCWDTCHVAVAYEEPADVLARYEAAGIRVGRLQISSALKVDLPVSLAARESVAEALAPFAESTYLHQVVQRNRDGRLRAFPDLDAALPAIGAAEAAAWRIHFHVPVFAERFGDFEDGFGSTQDGILATLALLDERPFTRYLEIETYTWDVLPPGLRLPLGDSIRREFEWVLEAAGASDLRHV